MDSIPVRIGNFPLVLGLRTAQTGWYRRVPRRRAERGGSGFDPSSTSAAGQRGGAARSQEIRLALPRVESVSEEGSGRAEHDILRREPPGSFSVARRLHQVRGRLALFHNRCTPGCTMPQPVRSLTGRNEPVRSTIRSAPRGSWIADDPRARSGPRPVPNSGSAQNYAPRRIAARLSRRRPGDGARDSNDRPGPPARPRDPDSPCAVGVRDPN